MIVFAPIVIALIAAAGVRAQTVTLNETFTTSATTTGGWNLTSGFWPAVNNSDNPQAYSPTGGAWGPSGSPPLFTSPPGGGYFATDTTATGNDNGTVSDWLMTPVLTLHNGDTIKFYTRTRSPEEGPSRMEVRLSTNGSSSNVGATNSSVGDFTAVLGTINSALAANTYPTSWTQFTFTVSGLSGTPTGRLAFRTNYANGGFGGPNGDTVGLAQVIYTTAPVTILTWIGPTSGSWNNSGNWSPTAIPASSPNTQLTFGATPNAAMTNDISSLILNSMTFTSAAPTYTLGGNSLNFQTNSNGALPQIVTNSPNPVTINTVITLTNNLTVSGSGNLTLNSLVAGTGSLTMNGTGTLVLGTGNTFAGGLNVNSGTVQAGGDAALGSGNVSGMALGTLSLTGTFSTSKSFSMGNGTIATASGQTVTFNGGVISAAVFDGTGTFASNGAQIINSAGMASVGVTSTNAADQFRHFNNSGAFSVAGGVNSGNTSSTVHLNGFINQGLGSVTIGALAKMNVANFQTYGTMNIAPAAITDTFTNTTLVKNVGTTSLGFSGGSRTFIGTPQTAVFPSGPNVGQPTFVAGIDLNGKDAIVAGGLFVNNGYVEDSSNGFAGTSTVVADFGSLVKGAGFFQNTVQTQNGGKFQAGNSPGAASFGSFVLGPGGVNNYRFAIDDATGAAGPIPDAAGHVSGWGLVKAVTAGPGGATPGAFTWTATSSGRLTVSVQTLINPTTVGTDVPGQMDHFDPMQAYSWSAVSWAGSYAGPTDASVLDAATTFDLSGFANPVAGRFGWALDLGGHNLSLTYTPSAVPEPGTLGLAALGAVAIWRARRRVDRTKVRSEHG
jgi:autotransporter-associated beta strand protein